MRILPLSLVTALMLVCGTYAAVAYADAPGTANGSACDLGNGVTGYIQNGQCVSADNYNSVSGVNSGNQNNGSVALLNPLKSGTSLESFLASILSFIVRIGTIIVVLMLVYVGYLFVVAQGSDSKLTEARRALLWTVIGALVLLGAQAIASAIQATVTALGG